MTKTTVTFGEIMLRLAPPGFERILQTRRFVATFGGGEANVAVALAQLGLPAAFVTVLPDKNPVAEAVVGELRRFGVDTSRIVRGKGRMGVYYVEAGANQRPSKVAYDRDYSAIALAKPGDINWERALEDAGWFHVTGITPAISSSAADLALEAAKQARAKGITVSCDLNYRKNLWKWGKPAAEVMSELVKNIDIAIANEEDVQMALGIAADVDVHSGQLDRAQYQKLTAKVLAEYPESARRLPSLCGNRKAHRTTAGRPASMTGRDSASAVPMKSLISWTAWDRAILLRRPDLRFSGAAHASGSTRVCRGHKLPEAFPAGRLQPLYRGRSKRSAQGRWLGTGAALKIFSWGRMIRQFRLLPVFFLRSALSKEG